MKAKILSVGNEILSGDVVNTNAVYLANKLKEIGIDVNAQLTVADDIEQLTKALNFSFKNSDIIFTIGGLGPTIDDVTMETLSKFVKEPLIYNEKLAVRIEKHFRKQNIVMPPISLAQAYVPKSARLLKNEIGTAPGIVIRSKKKLIVSLPGPPIELEAMVTSYLLPILKKISKKQFITKSRTYQTTGLKESEIAEKLKHIVKKYKSSKVNFGFYPHPGEVDIKLTIRAKNTKLLNQILRRIENEIKGKIGDFIFSTDKRRLSEIAGELLLKTKTTVSIAESCTGGLVSKRLTDIPGSSKYFKFGSVLYSDRSKTQFMNVPEKILKKHGAVSKESAKIMAENIRRASKTDLGLGITGIAGPTGGTRTKPVGLVYIALATDKKTTVEQFNFIGRRLYIRHLTAQAALNIIRKYLMSKWNHR